YGNVQSLAVNGTAGNSIYNLAGTSALTTALDGGVGNDTFNVGAGDLGNLKGLVIVNGNAGTNAVTLDDHLSSFAGNYNLAVNVPLLGNEVSRNGFVSMVYSGVQSLTLDGARGGDVYYVNSNSGRKTLNSGGGQDSFNIGTGNLRDLIGLVTVN